MSPGATRAGGRGVLPGVRKGVRGGSRGRTLPRGGVSSDARLPLVP